jgi:hypothetical protein
LELALADEKSHTKQGQIERAQRLRQMIENLKEGHVDDKSAPRDESLKEQVEKRARAAVKK